MTRRLSETDAETLAVLRSMIATDGHAPTIRELATELGLASASSAHARLRSLEAAGAITRGQGRARIVHLTSETALV